MASDIADPDNTLGLTAYEAARGEPVPSPLPIERFIDYGLWVQRQVAPAFDPRPVARIDHHRGRFRLTLADGDAIHSFGPCYHHATRYRDITQARNQPGGAGRAK